MSVYLEEFGIEPIRIRTLGAHVINKNIGNGGNQYKKWEECFFGEVYLQVIGKLELTETPDLEIGERLEDADKYWVEDPIFKYPVNIKGWQTYYAIKKDKLTVIPVASGLEKPGIMKPARYPMLAEEYPSFSAVPISRIQTQNGLYYVEQSLACAASIIMWQKLGIILIQKSTEVDNGFWHKEDDEHPSPTCGVCLNRVYRQPDEKPVSESAYDPCYFCAVTAEPIDDTSAKVANQLALMNHGLMHDYKGHWFLYGDKYVVGGKADNNESPAFVRTGRGVVTMKDMRDQSFMHHASVCPWYAPKRALEERAIWSKDLKTVFLPNAVLEL